MDNMDKLYIDGAEFSACTVKFCKVSLLAIIGKNGALGCGFLNMATAEKFGEAIAIVTGVNCYDDMLRAAVQSVSTAAAALGVTVGMSGEQALKLMK